MKLDTIKAINGSIESAFESTKDFVVSYGGHFYRWIQNNPGGAGLFLAGNVLIISLASYLRGLFVHDQHEDTWMDDKEQFWMTRFIEAGSGIVLFAGNCVMNSLLATQHQLHPSTLLIITVISLATSILLSHTRLFTPRPIPETHDDLPDSPETPRNEPPRNPNRTFESEQKKAAEEERIRNEQIRQNKFKQLLIKLGEIPASQA